MWIKEMTNYDLRLTIDSLSVGFTFVNHTFKILNP